MKYILFILFIISFGYTNVDENKRLLESLKFMNIILKYKLISNSQSIAEYPDGSIFMLIHNRNGNINKKIILKHPIPKKQVKLCIDEQNEILKLKLRIKELELKIEKYKKHNDY